MKDATAESVTYSATGITQQVTVVFGSSVPSPVHSTVAASLSSVPNDGTTTSTITVTLKDATNTLVTSSTQVALTASAGSSVITTSPSTTTSGSVTFTVTDTVAESVTYTATDTTHGGIVLGTTTVVFHGAASASASTVSASPSTVADDGSTQSTITVTLKDSGGTVVPGKNVTLTGLTGSAVISPSSATTGTNGVATFTVTDTHAETVAFQAKDTTDSNLLVTQTASVTFAGGSVSTTNSTVSTSATAVVDDNTTTATVTVTLKDASGNLVAGKTVTLTAASGSATISAPSGVSNASGVVTFTVKDAKAETIVLTASDSTDSITFTTHTVSIVFQGGAVSAATSTVSSSTSGQVLDNGTNTATVSVTLKDSSGNPISGKTVTLSGSGSSVISVASGTSNASGVVTFSVTDKSAETVVYTAKDTTDNVTVTPTASVTFQGGTFSSVISSVSNATPASVPADGKSYSTITVTVVDTSGNPISGDFINLVCNGGCQVVGSGSTSSTQSKTNASGVATFKVSDATVETVTATVIDASEGAGTQIGTARTITFVTPVKASASLSKVTVNKSVVLTNGGTATISVSLKSSSAQVISAAQVNLSAGSGSSAVIVGSGTTNSGGVATFTITDAVAQSVTFSASAAYSSVALSPTVTIRFLNPVQNVTNFGVKSSTLTTAMKNQLKGLAALIKRGQIKHMAIVGYTDTSGAASTWVATSRARAAAVKAALAADLKAIGWTKGVSLTSTAGGSTTNFGTNASASQKTPNRRVVITLS